VKLTVSVPDDLWNRVRRPQEGASAVVQRALSALDNMPPRTEPSDAVVTAFDAEIEAIVARLVLEAGSVDVGYRVGIRAAAHMGWAAINDLRDCELPFERIAVRHWAQQNDEGEAFDTTDYWAVICAIEEAVRDELSCEVEYFPTIYEQGLSRPIEIGFNRAILQVRDRVLRATGGAPATAEAVEA
jgi:hypothetical protein